MHCFFHSSASLLNIPTTQGAVKTPPKKRDVSIQLVLCSAEHRSATHGLFCRVPAVSRPRGGATPVVRGPEVEPLRAAAERSQCVLSTGCTQLQHQLEESRSADTGTLTTGEGCIPGPPTAGCIICEEGQLGPPTNTERLRTEISTAATFDVLFCHSFQD